jgi:hypothetical protein
MRSALGLAASALAAIAAAVATASDPYIVNFFIGLAFGGAVEAAAAYPPFEGWRRNLARGLALLWLVAGFWIGVLLLMYTAACGCSYPEPEPTVLIVGVPATVYHLIGLYGGLALILASAFGPDRWFSRSPSIGGTGAVST